MNQVLVLLSCYNGALYLEEQLKSLLNQINVDVHILARDDGSTDATKEILTKFESTGKLKWYAGENIGWRKSFMHLALNAPACQYYAFCDQDDIWLPNKLFEAVLKLENTNFNTDKHLYFSNLFFWRNGKNLGRVKESILKISRQSCVYQNPAIGCTIVFNKELLDFIKANPFYDVYAHDFWFFQTAYFLGDVVYDPNAYILYRQHNNNQIGIKRDFFSKWTRRAKNFMEAHNGLGRSQNAMNFLNIYGDYLTCDDYKIFDIVANYKKSLSKKIYLLFSSQYTMNAFVNTLLLKIRILFNRF